VLGVDIARNLVEAGNRRAKELGLANLRFRRATRNLTSLPIAASISSSASSARCSRPSRSTSRRRWCRVTQPGGRIVMGNWIPNDRRWSRRS
jgi:ubiquinone/menaquinone biosynthesis C-methylase UbiE